MPEQPLMRDFYEWKQLLFTKEWHQYIKILEKQSAYLQKEVNQCVRDNNLNGAIRNLAQLDLIPRMMGKVQIESKKKEKED